MSSSTTAPYDALLLCSFGGPNRPEDVMPFLRNVTAGKGIPDERLADVAHHYELFGGRSPINEQNLALRDALIAELASRDIELPVIWGNRNWHPYTVDTLRDAVSFGARRILVLVTSAYASYSGSRQYREHLAEAVAELDAPGLEVDMLRPFFNDPGFIAANADHVAEAAERLSGGPEDAHIVYVTHSIPDTMERASGATGPSYVEQHEDVRATIDGLVAERLGVSVDSSLAYCSRSGDPRTPWLEPDINEHLTALTQAGVRKVVIAPIGFVSDHLEVAYDLDMEAVETARDLGVEAVRAATAGTHPAFIAGLVDLILERAARERGEPTFPQVMGAYPAFPDAAPPGSCRMRDGEVTGIPVLAGTAD